MVPNEVWMIFCYLVCLFVIFCWRELIRTMPKRGDSLPPKKDLKRRADDCLIYSKPATEDIVHSSASGVRAANMHNVPSYMKSNVKFIWNN